MSHFECPRPLDPADAEALASGAEPLFSADAAAHAASCPSCGEAVLEAARLSETLEAIPLPVTSTDLAARVVRLRPFSRAERRDPRLWAGPAILAAGAFAGGVLLLTPGLTGADRAGLGAGAAVALFGVLRSFAGWTLELVREAPRGLDALASVLRGEVSLGAAALLLLLPAAFGLRRTLARAAHRR